ncbi:hypothetical protein [Agaribacter marinus]|uniref:Zinc ribbon domain-containing protein n=1 Tax=Agaribacter marinus TaxID=1431249 RepID=A0AA37SUY6_9ALTE|nr:hypothetical protein [Agaribacter marinus]GLR69717.1 hypothetical protein GCM10007852_06250 [Agaribacter marinus]
MAITSCPSCSKPISDKAKQCQHCNLNFGDASAEDIQRKANFEKYKNLQKLQNQSMMAIVLFLIGAYFTFLGDFENSDSGMMMFNASVAVTTIGFIWYGVNRARIALAKRK